MKLLKNTIIAIFFCLVIIQCKNFPVPENGATIALYSDIDCWDESIEAS